MKKTEDKTKVWIFVLAAVAVLAVAAAVFVGIQKRSADEKQTVQAEQRCEEDSSYITYNGKKYEYNTDLRTMLFMGVDKDETVTVKEITGRSGQADCLILLVLDTESKKTTLLEISRDSMADIKIYGMDGRLYGNGYDADCSAVCLRRRREAELPSDKRSGREFAV